MTMEAVLILTVVSLQRLGELILSRHNTKGLLDEGAWEAAPGHYPFLVALHASWLGGLWLLAPGRPVDVGFLLAYLAVQPLRIWILATLEGRWTTRIIILPNSPLVRHGPYAVISHPNYLVVVAEVALLPMAFHLGWYALIFSALNAAILLVRIHAENIALGIARPRAVTRTL
jgi:methyltransferase